MNEAHDISVDEASFMPNISTFFLTNSMNHAEWSLTMFGLYKNAEFFWFFQIKET